MGRHSAPEDTDEDVDVDGVAPGGGATTTAATAAPDVAEPAGRHAHGSGARPRPVPAAEEPGEPGEPDDDAEPPVEGLSLLEDAFEPARPGVVDPADAPTTRIPVTELVRDDRALPEETTATIPPVVQAPVDRDDDRPGTAPRAAQSGHATSADLALIRTHGDVRARVIAAVIAPFVVFVAVFAVRGNLDVHSLVWIWIPAVVAGVLVGVLLDAGHKRYVETAHAQNPE